MKKHCKRGKQSFSLATLPPGVSPQMSAPSLLLPPARGGMSLAPLPRRERLGEGVCPLPPTPSRQGRDVSAKGLTNLTKNVTTPQSVINGKLMRTCLHYQVRTAAESSPLVHNISELISDGRAMWKSLH